VNTYSKGKKIMIIIYVVKLHMRIVEKKTQQRSSTLDKTEFFILPSIVNKSIWFTYWREVHYYNP